MSTYAIGDVQGCYDELMDLLEVVHFDPASDMLWFVGDLVNRGPKSLQVLRFIKNLGVRQRTVLGNHDIHLLAVAAKCRTLRHYDTLQSVLKVPDAEELFSWLRCQKLVYYDYSQDCILVHAGIYPLWGLEEALRYAREVEDRLCVENDPQFLAMLFGEGPFVWNPELRGELRYRFIVNAFTRMRFCDSQGILNFSEKGPLIPCNQSRHPWFDWPGRKPIHSKIIFGHWTGIRGVTHQPRIFGVDTGCIWGHQLTALRLEDEHRFSVEKRKVK